MSTEKREFQPPRPSPLSESLHFIILRHIEEKVFIMIMAVLFLTYIIIRISGKKLSI